MPRQGGPSNFADSKADGETKGDMPTTARIRRNRFCLQKQSHCQESSAAPIVHAYGGAMEARLQKAQPTLDLRPTYMLPRRLPSTIQQALNTTQKIEMNLISLYYQFARFRY
jgi:hypothetical protein